jgi:2-dehydropantoate 2-reductase
MRNIEFAILGSGALGSILGAHLSRAGHEVVMLARGRRAEQVASVGLCIRGLVDLSVAVPVLAEPRRFAGAETLIVATKAIGTAAALEPLRGATVRKAFSIQNGVLKDELLREAFGRQVVLGALANFSGELLASGEVLFTRNNGLLIGELEGERSHRAVTIAGTLEKSGIAAAATQDILGYEWSKFAAWFGLMALSVTTRRLTWEYLSNSGAALTLVRLVREVGWLAHASGIQLADIPLLPVGELCRASDDEATAMVLSIGRSFRENAPTHRVSTLQDLEAGRPLELEETLGHAIRLARRLGQDVALLESFLGVLSAASDGPSPDGLSF